MPTPWRASDLSTRPETSFRMAPGAIEVFTLSVEATDTNGNPSDVELTQATTAVLWRMDPMRPALVGEGAAAMLAVAGKDATVRVTMAEDGPLDATYLLIVWHVRTDGARRPQVLVIPCGF